jgi:Tfp pilus assembly protein PilF
LSARDTLAEEEALLEQARRALTTSPGTALTLLRQHQQRFPAGQLTAERLFLSVDALRRTGDRAGADRQAQALLKRFPRSVYAGQLRNQTTP